MKKWLFFFFFANIAPLANSWGAPPIDVTRFEEANRNQKFKARPMRESDFEMLDVNDPQPDIENETAAFVIDVVGRTHPFRNGKPVLRGIRHDRVRFLKLSKDKRWAAVQSMRSGKKAWVPVNSLDSIPVKKSDKSAEKT